ncbi:LANO_0D04962g1_1 [Lachancea nothofagi CBS 11611]|uniref:LANO_0D04962g1_1 n=1 Tax=Lachancea nothofagi CBS 11611 TaxID=1266666 RepID=A0A1G4JGX7_9SACH|nr:LANO_0D04962g1_1 [Lachancea nothofagi CBS 11611]
MNNSTDKSPSPSPTSRASKSSSPNANSSGDGSVKRAKRTISQNVDYNLKKRRIIPAEDITSKRGRKSSASTTLNHDVPEDALEEKPSSKHVIEYEPDGRIIFNEPEFVDPINGMTGLPLGMGPPEKVKKESYWSYKKNNGQSTNGTPSSASSAATYESQIPEDNAFEEQLETKKSEQLTKQSSLRSNTKPKDIYRTKRQYRKKNDQLLHRNKHFPIHTKIKASTTKENKLFGQNSITNQKTIAPAVVSSANSAVENDDFCSSCRQPGIFLCCDTCPKSFHFACCNPPLDPDNLPEGDWSCAECQFKIRCPNKSVAHKLEKEYTSTLDNSQGKSIFGKLLFKLEFTNPRQFIPPVLIRDAFVDVKMGLHGEYTDGSMRGPLNEKQALNTGYGQSLTKMDQYNPDQHIDQESGELLICFKCRESKMGSIDHPEKERLITKCDYCKTPWHLDCLPEVPRASFKNLGSKWMCPLHADSLIPNKKRRLVRHQRHFTPDSTHNFSNNGDVDIVLDEISAPISKEVIHDSKINKELAIMRLPENSIQLDFVDKVYRAKGALLDKQFRQQETLITKTLGSLSKQCPDSKVSSFLYFTLQNNGYLQKMWDFKELCHVADKELQTSCQLRSEEISELLALRRILESKSKEEVMDFLV